MNSMSFAIILLILIFKKLSEFGLKKTFMTFNKFDKNFMSSDQNSMTLNQNSMSSIKETEL